MKTKIIKFNSQSNISTHKTGYLLSLKRADFKLFYFELSKQDDQFLELLLSEAFKSQHDAVLECIIRNLDIDGVRCLNVQTYHVNNKDWRYDEEAAHLIFDKLEMA